MPQTLRFKLLFLKGDWIAVKSFFKRKVLPKVKDIALGKLIDCHLTASFNQTYKSEEGIVTFIWVRRWTERRRLFVIAREVHPFKLHCTSDHPLIDNFILTDKMDPKEAFLDLVEQTAKFRSNWEKMVAVGKRLEGVFNGRETEGR